MLTGSRAGGAPAGGAGAGVAVTRIGLLVGAVPGTCRDPANASAGRDAPATTRQG